jgi:outer membrane protein assembly factor BamB
VEPRHSTTYLGEPDRSPSAGEHLPDSLVLLWDAGIGRSAAGPVALGDSVVVTQGSDNKLSLYLRHSGARVWQSRLKGPSATGAVFDGEMVFAASGDAKGRLHGYEFGTGKKRWDATIGPVAGPLAVRGARVFAATATGWLFSFDAATGEPHWSRPFPRPLRAGVTVLDSLLIVATEDSLFLVGAEDGQVEASALTPGTVISPPAVSGSVLVVTTPDGFVAAYDRTTLDQLWEQPLGEPVFGAPAIARDTVFVVTLHGTLWRIPLRDPAGALTLALGVTVRATAVPLGEGVLLGTVEGEIWWVVPGDPEPRWRRQFRPPIDQPPVVDGGELFILDGRGKLHVLGAPVPEQ